MSIMKTLLAGAAGTALASGMAVAGEPMKLSTTEMDQITAGLFQTEAQALPNALNGATASFSERVFAAGRENTSINSPTSFSSNVAANAGGTATGEGTGGLVTVPGVGPVLFPGNFVFGGLGARSQVATNVAFGGT